MLLALLALSQASTFASQHEEPLAVYRYGHDLALRERLVATGGMLEDLGGWVLGAADPELAGRLGAVLEPIPGLAAGETLAVVLPHGEHAHPGGRLLWAEPARGATLRALGPAELKDGVTAGFRCHGAFRVIPRGQTLRPVRRPAGGYGRAITPNPSIQGMVAQVSQAALEAGVGTLVAFGTRRHEQPGEVQAQNWILAELAALGLTTSLHDYDAGADVVIGELTGQLDPSRIVVIGAHYDSINYAGTTAPAPGADDDGSGTAGVLEIARVLSQHDFAYTIRFCAFSGEEYGLLGSEAYAAHLDAIGANVIGMVQLDMTAYRAAGDPRSVDFVLNDTDPLLNAFSQDCFGAYVPGLSVLSGTLAGGTSDHRSFTQHGFPAIFPFEDLGQYSPYIHTASDTVGVSANDFVLATQITQGALATVAELARPLAMELQHAPLPDTQNEAGPYRAFLTATPLVGQTVVSAALHWRVDQGVWQTTSMVPTANVDEWRGDIPGQVSPAAIEYWLEANDALGNRAWLPDSLTAGGEVYDFVVGIRKVIFFDDFESERGWTHQMVATQDDWQRGAPQGRGGSSSGVSWSDPAAAWSGTQVWANDLGAAGWNGSYAANVHNWLESPAIDCSTASGTRLRFRRWLSVEEGTYDHARIELNGTLIWQNPTGSHVLDSAWTEVEYDVAALADGNPSVRVRFRLQSDGGLELGGWNLDDFELWSLAPVGGTDTILLSGPTQGSVGANLGYAIANAPPQAPWWLVWSPNLNGQSFQGHTFDLGLPATILHQGVTDAAGAAAWTSGPVPPAAAGRTLFLEAAATAGGRWYDSNPLTLVIL